MKKLIRKKPAIHCDHRVCGLFFWQDPDAGTDEKKGDQHEGLQNAASRPLPAGNPAQKQKPVISDWHGGNSGEYAVHS